MKLTFLNAPVALTKSYTKLSDGTIEKTSYPNVWEVTSIIEDCPDLSAFEQLIIKHAKLGNCLLKGMVTRNLINESRRDSTDRNATTEFLCLDIDGIDPVFTSTTKQIDPITKLETDVQTTINVTVDMILEHLGLKDVSYILQWSGSMNISNNTLRCHVFIMLTKPMSAPLIKQWLIQKNHELTILREHQSLTKTGNALTWGLDITACQSDKLIYIADPVLKGIKNPLGRLKRISLINKTQATFDLVGKINTTEQNRVLTDARIIELRDLAGLPKRKLNLKTVGAHQVLAKPDECIATEMKTDRGFVYFNLNGGDSWAYYHPENNPDYIFNFKGEPTYLTKELLPSYWESLKTQAYRVSSTGITYLAFLDRKTSTYWRGGYDATNDLLDLYAAKNENMVRQFADANGMRLGDNIPEWDMEFNPEDNVRVDFDNCTVNTFELTSYMRTPVRKVTKCPAMIFRIIDHILKHDVEAIEHFMNWLAYIAQLRTRTRTAWVFQGIPGTGKGLLINRILRPLFGENQTAVKRAGELSEKWTDFVAGKFIIFIDEIQSSALKDEAGVIANLKNFITEPTATVRMMNKNAFDVPNYSNWIFASNKPDPVTVDKDDRRFNVGPYQGVKFDPTDAELDLIPGELQDFMHYLMSYPVDKNQACTVLQSAARDTLIQLSQTTSESTATALREGNFEFFLDQLPSGDEYKLDQMSYNKVELYRRTIFNVICRTKPDGKCSIHRDELYIIFNHTVGGMSASPTTFTKFLGHRQIEIRPVTIDSKTVRGIQTTWGDLASIPQQLKTYFSDFKVKV
jgi:DNA polymerase III delta prime subunit